MSSQNKEVDKFCRKYDAVAGPSHRRYRRPRPVDYKIWSESDPEMFFTNMAYDDVAMVEIHLPEDRFRALIEHDDWISHAGLSDNRYFQNNVSRVSNLIVEHERECRIRNENPAVQKAWEKYQLLLNTVKDYYR
jgi:hypothetical protein